MSRSEDFGTKNDAQTGSHPLIPKWLERYAAQEAAEARQPIVSNSNNSQSFDLPATANNVATSNVPLIPGWLERSAQEQQAADAQSNLNNPDFSYPSYQPNDQGVGVPNWNQAQANTNIDSIPHYQLKPTYPHVKHNHGSNYNQPNLGNWDLHIDDRLASTLRKMVGHSIREFDPRVTDDLGCAAFVSYVLRDADGLPIRDTNTDGLEHSLKRCGYVRVKPNELRPKDVIVAHRRPGRPGHAAMYLGGGLYAANSSNQKEIVVDSINRFNNNDDYVNFFVYRRIDTSSA